MQVHACPESSIQTLLESGSCIQDWDENHLHLKLLFPLQYAVSTVLSREKMTTYKKYCSIVLKAILQNVSQPSIRLTKRAYGRL
jgi:hypothetical protein